MAAAQSGPLRPFSTAGNIKNSNPARRILTLSCPAKSGRFLPPFHSAVKDETLNKAAEILAARNKNLAEEIEAFKQSYLKTSREKTLENHIGDCLQKIVIRHA